MAPSETILPQNSTISAEWPPCSMWKLLVTGFLAGTLFGTIGVGAGIVMVPLLTLWCRVPIKLAMGASLAATVVAGVMSTSIEFLMNPEGLRLLHSFMLFIGALLGVQIGSRLQGKLPDRQLAFAFAGVLVFSALKFAGYTEWLFAQSSGLWNHWFDIAREDTHNASILVGFVAVGILGGITSPLFGLGGGTLYVPGMMILFAGFDDSLVTRRVSIVAVMLTTAYSTYVQGRRGLVRLPLVKQLIPGVVGGAAMGYVVAGNLDKDALKMVMAVVVIVAAIQMVYSNLRKGRTRVKS